MVPMCVSIRVVVAEDMWGKQWQNGHTVMVPWYKYVAVDSWHSSGFIHWENDWWGLAT